MALDPPVWRRPAPALLTLLWLTLPATAGAALAPLLDGATSAGRTVAWTLAALAYGAGTVAVFRPGALALTVLRILTKGHAVLVAAPAIVVLPPVAGGSLAALAVLLAGLAWSSPVAQMAAEASAVPGEQRFFLAAPAGLVAVLGPLAAAWATGLPGWGLLLATGAAGGQSRPLVGTALVIPGLALALLLVRALHRLARRWLVLVPAGVVLHDPLLFSDSLRLAPDEIGAVALTTRGWRERVAAPGVLDATGGVRRGLWLGLTVALVPPTSRPASRRGKGSVSHVFCAPTERALAAAALAAKGYAVAEPVGPP